MIISDEQVSRALSCIVNSASPVSAGYRLGSKPLDVGLVARIQHSMDAIPEIRSDRIEQARRNMQHQKVGSSEIAHKMIGRLISDSLR